MGDISVIARRLTSGKIQCAWSGNGGYLSEVGAILLTYYNFPDMVEKLFSFGQISHLGVPEARRGTEEDDMSNFFMRLRSMFVGEYEDDNYITAPKPVSATEVTGERVWVVKTENEAADKAEFTDYMYFYDIDNHWYFYKPSIPTIRIPLETAFSMAVRDKYMIFNKGFVEIYHRFVEQLLNDFIPSQPELSELIAEKSETTDSLKDKLRLVGDNRIYDIANNYRWLWNRLDKYCLAIPTDDFKEIERFDIALKSDKTTIERLSLADRDCTELAEEIRAQLVTKNILARTLSSFYKTLNGNRKGDDPDTISYISELISNNDLECFISAFFERFLPEFVINGTNYAFELSDYEMDVLVSTMEKHIIEGIDFNNHKIREDSVLYQYNWK